MPLTAENAIGVSARQITIFAEDTVSCMTAQADMAGLADAASDTAGTVGAVHHDMSPEACGIS